MGGSGAAGAPGFAAEEERILHEHRRRAAVDRERDDPTNPSALYIRGSRARAVVRALADAGVFPRRGDPCLEIGCASLGWLADLLSWRLRESDLHGLELDPDRVAIAKESFPSADIRVGDATRLPWPADRFALVIASTLFSSILDQQMQRAVAAEIVRVLRPGGALLWYDLRVDNPSNRNVRGFSRGQVRALFTGLTEAVLRRTTLIPPLIRLLAGRARLAAELLEAVPLLRTHYVGVFIKEKR
jgi:SAM-dependent methyltransferase